MSIAAFKGEWYGGKLWLGIIGWRRLRRQMRAVVTYTLSYNDDGTAVVPVRHPACSRLRHGYIGQTAAFSVVWTFRVRSISWEHAPGRVLEEDDDSHKHQVAECSPLATDVRHQDQRPAKT